MGAIRVSDETLAAAKEQAAKARMDWHGKLAALIIIPAVVVAAFLTGLTGPGDTPRASSTANDPLSIASQKARTHFSQQNPTADVQWMTVGAEYVMDGTEIRVDFDYKVTNAYGATVRRHKTIFMNKEMTEITDQADSLVGFEK